MDSWKRRYLTLAGRIVVIKTLLLPILTHVLTTLPRPTGNFLNRLRKAFFEFVWNSKIDKIKRGSLCKLYDQGGFSMIDVDLYVTALHLSWVRREITEDHIWSKLFDHEIAKGRFLWNRNETSLKSLSSSTNNRFWADVMIAMAQYDSSVTVSWEEVGKHSIWYSKFTKFKGKEIQSWKRKGLVNINDLLNEDGDIQHLMI